MIWRTFQCVIAATALVTSLTASGQGKAPDTGLQQNLSDESLRSNKPEPLTQLGAAQSPAYEQGWRDGCTTGLYVRGFRLSGAPLRGAHFAHDAALFHANKDYTVGWGDGLNACDRLDLH